MLAASATRGIAWTELARFGKEYPRQDLNDSSKTQGKVHSLENSVLPAQTFSEKQLEIDAQREWQQLAELWPQLTPQIRSQILAIGVASIENKRGGK